MNEPNIQLLRSKINASTSVVIAQADNPDADSLGSALALEQILGDLGKQTHLYCGVDTPGYLHYLTGWSRIQNELPRSFDLVVVVDASTKTLFEKVRNDTRYSQMLSTTTIVLDHHAVTDNLIEADITINNPTTSSTGELIYIIAKELNYSVNTEAAELLMTAILGDTQGLSNDLASPQTFRVIAELLELGVDRTDLEERRRKYSRYTPEIYRYKADLIKRTVLTDEGIAYVTIPQNEINTYSPAYNPAALIQPDMLQVQDVRLSVVFKSYDYGRITGAIRASLSAPIAGELAKLLGGGGHKYASGFKVTDGRSLSEIQTIFITECSRLLNEYDMELNNSNETI